MRDEQKNVPITWSQLIIAVPIMVALVGAISYFSALKQRQDITDDAVKEIKQDIKDIKSKTNDMAVDIARIKEILNLRAANQAGASATIRPTVAAANNPAKQEVAAVPASQQQTQTVIAPANPSPMPSPIPSPTPASASEPIPILPSIIPSSILGITLLGIIPKRR